MKLPAMKYPGGNIRNQTAEFGGINRRNGAAEGEFADCGNLSFAEYPALAPKKKDSVVKNYAASGDIFEWNGRLVTVDGTSLLLDDEEIGTVMPGSKQFAVVNTKLVIWPDKVLYDLETGDFQQMDLWVRAENGAVIGSSTITFPENYTFSGTFTKLSDFLATGDFVNIWGVPGTSQTKEYKIFDINDETRTLTFEALSFTPVRGTQYYTLEQAQSKDETLLLEEDSYENEYGVVEYYCRVVENMPAIQAGNILFTDVRNYLLVWNPETNVSVRYNVARLSRRPPKVIQYPFVSYTSAGYEWPVKVYKGQIPGMDFICSHNNRLYGVSNSANAKEQTAENFKSRAIYVSALGMPDKFSEFSGADTDSYSAAEASNGDFTGCCEYGDYVLFFKEHKVVKFYGDYPSNMGYSYDDIEGVKAGCHRSLVIANEVLYYMGRDGYYAYTGSVPRSVSYKLDREYEDVVCGTDGKRILLSGRVGSERELMEYQPQYGEWLRIGPTAASAFALANGRLHYLEGSALMRWEGGEGAPEWFAEFHPWTENTFKRKRWKFLRVRAEIEAGAEITIKVKIGDHETETMYRAEKTGWQTIKVPLPLMRTDRMVLTLQGSGGIVIHAIEREYQTGSDL